MKKLNGRIVLKNLVFLVFLVVLSLLFFLCTIFVVGYFSNNKEKYTYQYYQYNPPTKESTSRIVKRGDKLEEQEYISYEDAKGNHVLISNLGSPEYKCTGKCICNDQYANRRIGGSVIPLQRGLIYLVAAFSSFKAIELAKQHFTKLCMEKNDENEKCDDIEAEIDNCALSNQIREEDEDREYYPTVKCSGHCFPRNLHNDYPPEVAKKLIIFAVSYDCEDLFLEREEQLTYFFKDSKWSVLDHAYHRFKIDLNQFCSEKSQHRISYLDMYWTTAFICMGKKLLNGEYIENPTIKCEQLD